MNEGWSKRRRRRRSGPRQRSLDLRADPQSIEARPVVRLKVLGAVALTLVGLLVLRLWSLQVLDAKTYASTVSANETRVVAIPAERGLITDRSGVLLVGNVAHYTLTLTQQQAHNDPSIIGRVAALVGESPTLVTKALSDPRYLYYQPTPIATNVAPATVQYLVEHQSDFPGVAVTTSLERSYPQGGVLGANLLGYVGAINGTELSAHPNQGYLVTSNIGKTGVEAQYEQFLRGRDGTETLFVNPIGDVLGVKSRQSSTTGSTVVLNLDAGLQAEAQRALAAQIAADRRTVDPRSGRLPPAPDGAVVVLDPRNGSVLALASYPGYNLNQWVGGISTSSYQQLLSAGALTDYAVQGAYTPGSTFKLVTATAALNDGLISPATMVNDPGTFTVPGCAAGQAGCTFHDDETTGNGQVNLASAITRSSDVYFYNLGYLFWANRHRYGTEPVQTTASHYGLDSTTGIDLPNESASLVDSPSIRQREHNQYPKAYPNSSWYTGDNIEMAFGQGGTQVTPIGLATAYATFANGGTRYAPQLAAAVVNRSGSVLERYAPKVVDHVALAPGVRSAILAGLEGVVANPNGTAYGAFKASGLNLAAFPVAGKTGTASNRPGQEPNSWFVGFGPVDASRYVVLCVIDQGGYGAAAAAPVVAHLFSYLSHHPVHAVALPSAPPATTTTTKAVG